MTETRSDIERRLRELFAPYAHEVAAVYLFGSVANETAGAASDIDIGVLFRVPPRASLDAGGPLDLEGVLERAFGRRVDVVALNHAPVDLRARVLRGGRLVIDGDPSARIRFEVATRNEAFDLAPVLREYRAPRRTSS